MAFNKCNYCDGETVISAENLNCMQDAILEHEGRLDNLTPAQIGAAPDGFGLGKTSPRATDANAQRRNGATAIFTQRPTPRGWASLLRMALATFGRMARLKWCKTFSEPRTAANWSGIAWTAVQPGPKNGSTRL